MHACLGICSRDSLTATPVHGEIKKPKECTLYASSVRGFCSKWATMSLSYPGGLKVCMHRTTISHNSGKKVPVNCERVSGGQRASLARPLSRSVHFATAVRPRFPPRAADSTGVTFRQISSLASGGFRIQRIKDSH